MFQVNIWMMSRPYLVSEPLCIRPPAPSTIFEKCPAASMEVFTSAYLLFLRLVLLEKRLKHTNRRSIYFPLPSGHGLQAG